MASEPEAYVVKKQEESDREDETDGSYSRSHSVRAIVLYKRRWVILGIFSLISMSNEIIYISYSSIASVIKEYYNVDYSQVTWLAMMFNAFYFLVPLATLFMNRFGLKLTIITGAVLNAISCYFRIAGRHRDGFTYVMIGNGFAAFGQCFILFVPPTLAAVWFSDNERAKATSIGVQANMFGIAVGFLMGGLLVPNTKDYDGVIKDRLYITLLFQAILCSILVLVSIVFLKESPRRPPSMSQYLKRKSRVNKINGNSIIENHNARFTDQMISYNIAMDTQYSNFEDFQKAMKSLSNEKRKQSTVLDLKLNQSNTQRFLYSARKLFRNISFHLILQAFSLFSAPFLAISVNINHWCTLKFPGNEQNIGIMGFVGIICGIIGMPIAGVIIDKTHRYKLLSVILLSGCAVTLLAFTLVLLYSNSFPLLFVIFCLNGLVSYPFMPVALEYAADITYPIAESSSSSIMFGFANLFGLIVMYLVSFILERKKVDLAGYVMTGCYVAALLCVVFIKGQLKRLDADKTKSISFTDGGGVTDYRSNDYLSSRHNRTVENNHSSDATIIENTVAVRDDETNNETNDSNPESKQENSSCHKSSDTSSDQSSERSRDGSFDESCDQKSRDKKQTNSASENQDETG